MYSGKRRRSVSPGGREYEEVSSLKERRQDAKRQGYKSKDKEYRQIASGGYSDRRSAYGFNNPPHNHPNIIPIFRERAASPNPYEASSEEEKKHLMKPERHFQTETGIVQDHTNTVIAHHHGASAGQTWNDGGHQQHRNVNLEKNKKREKYHGLEEAKASARSGHKEPRYTDPRPSKGSHPMYWNVNHPEFQGGFGPYYRQV